MCNIEHFMKWLDEEIKKVDTVGNDNMMKWGAYSEAIRIRQMLCDMNEHDKDLEDELGKICDKYCRYPEAYGDREDDRERMIQEKCHGCPIERLIK